MLIISDKYGILYSYMITAVSLHAHSDILDCIFLRNCRRIVHVVLMTLVILSHPYLWNSLPAEVRTAETYSIFRKKNKDTLLCILFSILIVWPHVALALMTLTDHGHDSWIWFCLKRLWACHDFDWPWTRFLNMIWFKAPLSLSYKGCKRIRSFIYLSIYPHTTNRICIKHIYLHTFYWHQYVQG